MALRTKPLYRIGHKPNYFLGGDREVVLLFGTLGFSLMIQGETLVSRLVGVGLWVFGLYWARAMVKRDPLWRHVWQRRRSYAQLYLARSTPFRDNTPIQARRYR